MVSLMILRLMTMVVVEVVVVVVVVILVVPMEVVILHLLLVVVMGEFSMSLRMMLVDYYLLSFLASLLHYLQDFEYLYSS